MTVSSTRELAPSVIEMTFSDWIVCEDFDWPDSIASISIKIQTHVEIPVGELNKGATIPLSQCEGATIPL